jgi:DNA (cytosine-5)-methyltransferase 1
MNHIELFAGCGGLSLGLEKSGFELLLANELSPMASETFAYNHLGVDLKESSSSDMSKVLWLSSQFARTDLPNRLRENPQEAAGRGDQRTSDLIDQTDSQLRRSLLVGSIKDLNDILDEDPKGLKNRLRDGFGLGGVDLVSGGPPCQSFSLAGMRDHTNDRNQLPWEFAKFVEHAQPRIALLESVSGILRPFTIDGKKYYAWLEVAKAFCKIGYIPLCLNVNAKYVGVAQNRPRFIMLGLRKDVCENFVASSEDKILISALEESIKFQHNLEDDENLESGLQYYDSDKDPELFKSKIISTLVTHKDKLVSVKDAIDDLRSDNEKPSRYVKNLGKQFKNRHGPKGVPKLKEGERLNHELRCNSNKVKARFRIYQRLQKLTRDEARSAESHLKTQGDVACLPKVLESLAKDWVMSLDGKKMLNPTPKDLLGILDQLYTKKQTQRALQAEMPAPAALSIPDDACHYHESEESLRTLTVREMARIQSFPDWYFIRSKVTTGGKMRKFEVPQYTQIGNAVPPLLGVALGKVCKDILSVAQ